MTQYFVDVVDGWIVITDQSDMWEEEYCAFTEDEDTIFKLRENPKLCEYIIAKSKRDFYDQITAQYESVISEYEDRCTR